MFFPQCECHDQPRSSDCQSAITLIVTFFMGLVSGWVTLFLFLLFLAKSMHS
jgi:hypothetical protein